MRKLLSALALALTAAVAVPGVAMASTVSPHVSHSVKPNVIFVLNETSGNYLIRDSNDGTTAGNPVVEGSKGVFGSATNIQWTDIHSTFTYQGHTYENGNLQWQSHLSWCVGSPSSGPLMNVTAVLQPCNGGHGTVFPLLVRNGADVFINRAATQANGNSLIDLSGSNNGSQFDYAGDQLPGWFQRFTPGGQ